MSNYVYGPLNFDCKVYYGGYAGKSKVPFNEHREVILLGMALNFLANALSATLEQKLNYLNPVFTTSLCRLNLDPRNRKQISLVTKFYTNKFFYFSGKQILNKIIY